MAYLKKHITAILLFSVLILSCVICIYKIWNYKSTGNIGENKNKIEQQSKNSGNQSNKPQLNTSGSQNTGLGNNQNTNQNVKNNQNQASGSNQNQSQNQNQDFNPSQSQGQNQDSSSTHNDNKGSMNQNNHPAGMMGGNTSSSNSIISPVLIVYLLAFIVLFFSGYYFIAYKKFKFSNVNIKLLLIILLCVGFLLRIFAATLMQGYSGDISLFRSWAQSAAKGFTQFYSSTKSSDYPPLYIYVLFVIGKLASFSALSNYTVILLKLPSIITDVAAAYLIYRLAKKHFSQEISILLCAFYIFNPVTFINSALWGQVDSFFTFLVVLAVFLLSERKTVLSTVFFTAAVLMKPQGIIFLPVLFFELTRQKSVKAFIKAGVCAIVTAVLIILPFSLNNGFTWIFKLYTSTVSEYPYASLNAFNLYSFLDLNHVNYNTKLLFLSYHSIGMFFIVLITLFSWFIYIKGKDKKFAFLCALIQIAGVFTLSVGMHERYLFPAVALAVLAFIYLKDIRLIFLSLGFSITSYINTHVVLFGGSETLSFSPVLLITSLANIMLLGFLLKTAYDISVRKKVVQKIA